MDEDVIGKVNRIGEGLLSALLDLLPDYFYVADVNMRLAYVNKTAADYFGLPKEEIVGKRFEDVEPDTEFARRFAEGGRQVMASGKPHVGDFGPYNEPDGTQSHFRRYEIPFRHPQTGEPMMIGLVQDMTDRVERERKERDLAAMSREMQIAREIQQSVQPKALHNDWLELAGFSEPAAYAGGDFYDWQPMPDGSVIIALGDVTGHGVGPALVAAECRAYWRVLARSLPLRAAVLRLNELVADDLQGSRFVTFAAARFSPRGRLEVFSAGQGPLVLRRSDGAAELLDSHTLPLGITADPPVTQDVTVRTLTPGDTLLIPSDGFTEARDPDGEQWTTAGLLACLSRHAQRHGADLIRDIEQDNKTFADNAPATDDRTLVLATYRGDSA